MVNNFSENIKNMTEVEFPKGLHGRIMHKLFFLRYKTHFVTIFSLVSLNVFVSAWRTWTRIVEMDTVAIIKDMLQGFDLSYYFISDFVKTILAYAPIYLFIIFLINTLILSYITYLFVRLRDLPMKTVS